MITVIDCGLGNPGSVVNMIRRIGGEAHLTSSPDEVCTSTKLVLPGVGAFDAGMSSLRAAGLDAAVRHAITENSALLLGICLGMQLLLDSSEEGSLPGLGLVPGRALRFQIADQSLRVPHMGWNTVEPIRRSTLFDVGQEEQRFYFVHSYYVKCDDPADVACETVYGHRFTSALERGRVLGTQFHPEKSHRFGMALMKRFVEA